MRFFHHKPDIIFTPAISTPGGGKYQFKGNFNGSVGYNFQYKTIQIVGLDTILPKGGDAIASITSNEGNLKDTIIVAGVKVYFSDNNVSKTADVFPAGVAPCPTEAVFINAGSSNSGIKLGSAAAQNLHANVCETQLVAIVFDNNTLLRKPVIGQTPHCEAGRKWTTYGNASDFQIYYTFNISKDTGRKQFDTFINGLANGDYIAITNTAMVSLKFYDSISSSLSKIGYITPPFGDTIGYISFIGKKGAAAGEAAWNYCKDPHGTCYISIEQSLSQNDKSNTIKDFSACYESMQQVMEKAIAQNIRDNSKNQMIISPNPTQGKWTVQGMPGLFYYYITDCYGKTIRKTTRCENTIIDSEGIAPGVYFLHFIQSNQKHIYTIMKTQ